MVWYLTLYLYPILVVVALLIMLVLTTTKTAPFPPIIRSTITNIQILQIYQYDVHITVLICMFFLIFAKCVAQLLCSVASLNRKRRQDPPLLAPLPVTRTKPLAPASPFCSKKRSPGTAHSARREERPGSSQMGGWM